MRQQTEHMFDLISGFWVAKAIYAAVRLGIPDQLADGPKTAADLAAQATADSRSVERLLRALTGAGIFARGEGELYALTPLGDTLRSDIPGSMAAFVLLQLGDAHHSAWGKLLHAVQTGTPAFDEAMGQGLRQFFGKSAELTALYGRAMADVNEIASGAVLELFDFGSYGRIVDVGGGEGGFLTAILQAHDRATGVLFDLPHVAETGRRKVEAAGLASRCECVGGDFFKAVPEGGDLYLLKWVLHNWDEVRCIEILKSCRRAMRGDARLLIVDTIIPSGDTPHPAKLIDLNMMVLSAGQERTEHEFKSLLKAAGFVPVRITATQSPHSFVEAIAS